MQRGKPPTPRVVKLNKPIKVPGQPRLGNEGTSSRVLKQQAAEDHGKDKKLLAQEALWELEDWHKKQDDFLDARQGPQLFQDGAQQMGTQIFDMFEVTHEDGPEGKRCPKTYAKIGQSSKTQLLTRQVHLLGEVARAVESHDLAKGRNIYRKVDLKSGDSTTPSIRSSSQHCPRPNPDLALPTLAEILDQRRSVIKEVKKERM